MSSGVAYTVTLPNEQFLSASAQLQAAMKKTTSSVNQFGDAVNKATSKGAVALKKTQRNALNTSKAMTGMAKSTSHLGIQSAKASVAQFQLASAAQDIAIVMQAGGRLDRALLGASNNLGVMAAAAGPTTAILGTLALVTLPFLFTALLDNSDAFKSWSAASEDARNKAAKLNEELKAEVALQKKLAEAKRDLLTIGVPEEKERKRERQMAFTKEGIARGIEALGGDAFRKKAVKQLVPAAESAELRRAKELYQRQRKRLGEIYETRAPLTRAEDPLGAKTYLRDFVAMWLPGGGVRGRIKSAQEALKEASDAVREAKVKAVEAARKKFEELVKGGDVETLSRLFGPEFATAVTAGRVGAKREALAELSEEYSGLGGRVARRKEVIRLKKELEALKLEREAMGGRRTVRRERLDERIAEKEAEIRGQTHILESIEKWIKRMVEILDERADVIGTDVIPRE